MNRTAKLIIENRVSDNNGGFMIPVMAVVEILGAYGIEGPDYDIKADITAGDVIREMLRSVNWTQQQLAQKADVQPSVINRMVKTDYSVGYQTIEKMLNAMGMDWHDWAEVHGELKKMNQ